MPNAYHRWIKTSWHLVTFCQLPCINLHHCRQDSLSLELNQLFHLILIILIPILSTNSCFCLQFSHLYTLLPPTKNPQLLNGYIKSQAINLIKGSINQPIPNQTNSVAATTHSNDLHLKKKTTRTSLLSWTFGAKPPGKRNGLSETPLGRWEALKSGVFSLASRIRLHSVGILRHSKKQKKLPNPPFSQDSATPVAGTRCLHLLRCKHPDHTSSWSRSSGCGTLPWKLRLFIERMS